MTISPDGRWLVSRAMHDAGGDFHFWEVGTWKRVRTFSPAAGSAFCPPLFSPEGRLLALAVSPQQIRLEEAATGRTIAHLSTLQPLQARPLAFSPDGTRLIAATNQKTALMWDLRRIRASLHTMDLDWDQPPYSPESPSSAAIQPIRSVRVVGEVLEPSARRAAELISLDQRLGSHPDDGDALFDRGRLRLRMATPAAAIADLERGLRLRPDDTDALILLAEAYRQAKNSASARVALESYLRALPRGYRRPHHES